MHIEVHTKKGRILKIPRLLSWVMVISSAYIGVHWLVHDAIWLAGKAMAFIAPVASS
jgi:hypothetical protein